MKKLTAILTALLLTAAVATSCAKEEPVKENDTQVEADTPAVEEEIEETLPAEDEETDGEEVEDEITEEESEEAEGEDVATEDTEETEPKPEEDENTPEEKPVEDESKPVEKPVENKPEEVKPEEDKPEEETETEQKPLEEVKPEQKPLEEVKPEEEAKPEENVPSDSAALPGTSAEVIEAINAIKAPEFMHGIIPVDIADPDALKMFTGLDSAKGIKEVAVCESMMGSQAFSLVVVKVDGADAKATAEAMKAGIDQRKWICVEADDIKVSGKDDTVMLIMIDSEYRESISVEDVNNAFKTVCGGTLDFEI